MNSINEVYQYKGPFTLVEEAKSGGDWRIDLNAIDDDFKKSRAFMNYKLICSYVFDDKYNEDSFVSWVDGAFGIFDDLADIYNPYTDDKHAIVPYVILPIYNEEHKLTSGRKGVFYNRDLPSWVVGFMFSITNLFSMLFNDSLNVIPIRNEEEFNLWLGEAPNRFSTAADAVIVPMTSAEIYKGMPDCYKQYFKGEDNGKIRFLPFQIADITKDEVILTPCDDLIQLFRASYRLPMDVFKRSVLEFNNDSTFRSCVLLSITSKENGGEVKAE